MSESWNNIVNCFLVPPDPEFLAKSWVAQIYTVDHPGQVFSGRKTLPGKITPTDEVMDKVLKGPNIISAKVVQVDKDNQFVCVNGETKPLVFRITNSQAEMTTLPDTKEKGLILNLSFAMHEDPDPEVVKKVLDIAKL